MWVGNNLPRAPYLKGCYRCHAFSTIFACVNFEDDEQGVSAWEIPLCPGLEHFQCRFFYSLARMDIVGKFTKREWITLSGVELFPNVWDQHGLNAGDGFGPTFTGLSFYDELRLSSNTALFLLLLYDTSGLSQSAITYPISFGILQNGHLRIPFECHRQQTPIFCMT